MNTPTLVVFQRHPFLCPGEVFWQPSGFLEQGIVAGGPCSSEPGDKVWQGLEPLLRVKLIQSALSRGEIRAVSGAATPALLGGVFFSGCDDPLQSLK
jgi:hypothetical protein